MVDKPEAGMTLFITDPVYLFITDLENRYDLRMYVHTLGQPLTARDVKAIAKVLGFELEG